MYHDGLKYIIMCDIQQMIQKIVFIDGEATEINFRGSELNWFYNTNVYTYKEFATLRNVTGAVNSHLCHPWKFIIIMQN